MKSSIKLALIIFSLSIGVTSFAMFEALGKRFGSLRALVKNKRAVLSSKMAEKKDDLKHAVLTAGVRNYFYPSSFEKLPSTNYPISCKDYRSLFSYINYTGFYKDYKYIKSKLDKDNRHPKDYDFTRARLISESFIEMQKMNAIYLDCAMKSRYVSPLELYHAKREYAASTVYANLFLDLSERCRKA